eukprot:COSAG05_NODE_3170_length_2268_cov_16.640051_2_plen_257_part_01
MSKAALFLRAEEAHVNPIDLQKAMDMDTDAKAKMKMVDLIAQKELDRLEESSDDNDSDEDAEHEDETPQERARRNWKKARKVLELVTSQRSAGLISAASAAGLNDIKDAAADAKNVLTVMRRGLSAGKTQFKIAVGLFQVLGEMPTVLNLRYPPIFRIGFLGKLSFLRFNVFSMFKIDCFASTSIHTKFLGTVFTPVLIVAALLINMELKKRKIKSAGFLLGKAAVTRQTKQLESDAKGLCFAAVFFLYPMLNTTGK